MEVFAPNLLAAATVTIGAPLLPEEGRYGMFGYNSGHFTLEVSCADALRTTDPNAQQLFWTPLFRFD